MKKYMLLFLCSTQLMVFANNGDQWADFLCTREKKETLTNKIEQQQTIPFTNTNPQDASKKTIEQGDSLAALSLGARIGLTMVAVAAISGYFW